MSNGLSGDVVVVKTMLSMFFWGPLLKFMFIYVLQGNSTELEQLKSRYGFDNLSLIILFIDVELVFSQQHQSFLFQSSRPRRSAGVTPRGAEAAQRNETGGSYNCRKYLNSQTVSVLLSLC